MTPSLQAPFWAPGGLWQVLRVQEGYSPRRVPAPSLSRRRRHHITRPHSHNTRVLPQPASGPDAPEPPVSGPQAYPLEMHGARPRSRRGPGGLRRRTARRAALPCPRPDPGRPAARVPSVAAAGRAAPGRTRRASVSAPPPPAAGPPTWRSPGRGLGSQGAGVVGVLRALGLHGAPYRGRPLSRGGLAG